MQFNPMSEDELKTRMIVHGGTYDFEVESAEETVSEKGNDMIVLKLKVFAADGTEYTVKDWLVATDHPLALAKLQSFCKTTGMLEHYNAGTLTGLACVGLAGKCKVAITESQQYGQQRKVADYVGNCPTVLTTPLPVGPTAAQTKVANNALPDDEIPF